MDPATLEQLRWGVLQFIVLLVAIALHEYGHAKAADMRGDPLPRAQGRVTLNPVAHWSLWGTLVIPGVMIFLPIISGGALPLMLIGWGKPVQISLPNPKTRRMDDILITLAGPAMNLVQAVVASLALGIVGSLLTLSPDGTEHVYAYPTMVAFLTLAVWLNCALVAFNLLPIPPLDGSRVFRYVVGIGTEFYAWLTRYSLLVLLLLVNIRPGGHSLLSYVTTPVTKWIATPFFWVADKISGLLG